MDHILKEGQLLIIRSSDNANYGRYKSYAFKKGGDLVAAVENMKLHELPEVEGEFQIVKGGNLHPIQYNPARHIFFAEQPHDIQEKFRNRNIIE